VATAIALSTRQSMLKVWNENFLWSAPSYFVGAGAAALAVGIMQINYRWLIPLLSAPLYLTYRSYKVYLGRIEDEQRHVSEMADLHLATIEALALAIDAKDQTSQTHIRRVQLYAAALARTVGMNETHIQGVKTAALLHDIGKLAVPEHILSKPGPLTPEEFQKIRAHPKVGADIISAVPFPYPVSPLILSHHERWDGKGYPAGLKGEEIPLGARILSVVDYFDALMAERPYHKAMSYEAAVALLQQEAGKGLDPHLVDRFIELLPTLQAEAAQLEEAVARKPMPEQGPQPPGRPATGLTPEPAKKNVFDDIALAHREIYALYEIAQAMGTSLGVSDTMALIAAKLSNLVPFSCAALFPTTRRRKRCAAASPRASTRTSSSRSPSTTAKASPGGSRATAARWSTRARAPTSKPPGCATRRRTCSRRSCARCCSTSGSSGRCRCTTRTPRTTGTTTAGSSIACASRRPPSSTTRCCSSRRRRTR
jgi:putative nucleotidyltransferase with HDIG domain